MRRRTVSVAAAVATLGAATLAGVVTPLAGQETTRGEDPPSAAAAADSLPALRAELAGIVEESDVPGVAVALVTPGGTPWTEGFGLADVATGTPVSSTTLFRAFSVSKSVLAVAALRLLEQGRFDLTAPLREAAAGLEFSNPWEDDRPVRVAHLLEHTTGFDELGLGAYDFGRDDGSLREALDRHPGAREARWPPGTWMAYNNGAYAVVAHLVEQVTGEGFEAHVGRAVLEPLDMTDSGFGLENVDGERLATAYLAPDRVEPAAALPLLIRPAGGLLTTAEDMASFVGFLLRRGEPLLDDTAITRMETPTTTRAARAGLGAGYGLGSYTSTGRGFRWHGHAGGTPSGFARYAYQPELGVGYALLMNGADGGARKRLEAALQDFLVGDREPPLPEAVPAPASPLSEYAGVYRQRTSSWQLTAGIERLADVRRVAAADGGLVLSPLVGGGGETLLPAGGDLFRREGDAEPAVVFLRDGEGRIAGLATWDADNLRAGNYERVPALRAWAPLVSLVLGVPLMLSILLVAPVRAVVAAVRKQPPSGEPWAGRLPLLAVLALVASILVLVVGVSGSDGILVLGRPGAVAIAFASLTWLFALLSGAALVASTFALLAAGADRGAARAAVAYALLVSLACANTAAFLASWGLIGYRGWG